jgi:hypothetical protein
VNHWRQTDAGQDSHETAKPDECSWVRVQTTGRALAGMESLGAETELSRKVNSAQESTGQESALARCTPSQHPSVKISGGKISNCRWTKENSSGLRILCASGRKTTARKTIPVAWTLSPCTQSGDREVVACPCRSTSRQQLVAGSKSRGLRHRRKTR